MIQMMKKKQVYILAFAWGFLLMVQLVLGAPANSIGHHQVTGEGSSMEEQADSEMQGSGPEEMAGAESDASDGMVDEEPQLEEDESNNNGALRWRDEMLEQDDEPRGLDSNIANAEIQMTPHDMATAAGHHHHHKHYVHGWLEMGAHTGKKGAFGWHDKHPVGGKGRR